MKLTIKRSEWLRGEGSTASYLLRLRDGKKCCLGFLAQELAPEASITNRGSPANVPDIPWPNQFIAEEISIDDKTVYYVNAACEPLMLSNDDTSLSEEEREGRLTLQFKRFDIDVEFVD